MSGTIFLTALLLGIAPADERQDGQAAEHVEVSSDETALGGPGDEPRERSAEEIAAGQQRVCRRIETTGTRSRARRECRTRDEWDALADAGSEWINESRRSINLENGKD